MLEVRELLERDDFLVLWLQILLPGHRVVRLVSQHHFVEDLGRVVYERYFVGYNVEEDDLAKIYNSKTSHRFQRIEAKVWLLMQAQKLQ